MTAKQTICSPCESEITEYTDYTTSEVMQLAQEFGADLPDHECDTYTCVCTCSRQKDKPGYMVEVVTLEVTTDLQIVAIHTEDKPGDVVDVLALVKDCLEPPKRELYTAYLSVLPDCDICGSMGLSMVAAYDGSMRPCGSWAYMCEKHMGERGVGLGVGRGQRLALLSDLD